MGAGDLRRLRRRAVWLLIIPFLVYASPSAVLLASGASVSTLGLALRAWAAGSIRKDRELATTGPYAHTRNPLYVGSFLLGAGITIAGGRWPLCLAFLLFFVVVYRATVLDEADELEERFGEHYREYAAHVPSVLPRITAYDGESSRVSARGFSGARYLRNREWEAALGTIATFTFLALRLKLGS